MKTFVFLHYGFEPPTQEIMEAWGKWFASIKDRIVDSVGPFGPGREVTPTGTVELPHDLQAVTGYNIIKAEDMDDAVKIAQGCPMITSVRVYEVMSM